MLYSYYVGVDLGQKTDYTAVAVLEESYWLTEEQAWQLHVQGQAGAGWVFASKLAPAMVERARSLNYYHYGVRPPNPPLALRHLERFELSTSYPTIVARVAALRATSPLSVDRSILVVDETGVGRPVVDMFKQAGQRPVPVTITAGFTPKYDPADDSYTVPKRDLVTTMALLLEQHRLLIPPSLPLADLLTRELQAFKRKVTPAGSDSYAAGREGQHDDLVLAVALAAWYRDYMHVHIEQAHAEYTGRAWSSRVPEGRRLLPNGLRMGG